MRNRSILAVSFVLGLSSLLRAAEPTLEERIAPIAKTHKGKIAVAVKDLNSGEHYELNADEVMQTASLIKLSVLIEAFRQADDKKIDLAKTITLTKDDKVPGSGVLSDNFSDGATFQLKDALRLMTVYSDNTATNIALDAVGIKNVNATMAEFKLPETRINAKVYKGSTTSVDHGRTRIYQLGSTTANDTVKLFELIHSEKAASPKACRTMLEFLKANDDKELLVRDLPEDVKVAHKSGATNRVRTDAGIFYIPDPSDKTKKKTIPVAVCVLTNENEDQRWIRDNEAQLILGKIGKAVYDHYSISK